MKSSLTNVVCFSFPCDFPDTKSGQEHWARNAKQLQEEQDKKPKAKRIAYPKLGVTSPFEPNWSALFGSREIADAKTSNDDDADVEMSDQDDETFCVLRGESYMQPFCFFAPGPENLGAQFIPVALPTLVRVVISVVGRGTLSPNTMVRRMQLRLLPCI